jgi:hypothetical protein
MSAAVEDHRETSGLGFAAEKAATISSFVVSQLPLLLLLLFWVPFPGDFLKLLNPWLMVIWLRKYSPMRRRATSVWWWLHASPLSAPG